MNHTILLVDDESRVLSGIQRVLSDEPYRVLMATSGAAALSIFKKTSIDVVIADQDMPEMSGTDLLTKIHADYPSTILIMLTGKATVDVAVDAINEGGIARFLTKPCEPKELALAIHQALMRKKVNDETARLRANMEDKTHVLEDIERKHPGITRVDIDAHGAIRIDEPPSDDI